MLVKKVVNKPITMLILFSLLIILSIYTFSRLNIDLFPEFKSTSLRISTDYAGSSAKEVEEKVTRILEGNLSLVKNIETMTSSSYKGYSDIILKFYHGTNLDLALNEVRDTLELSKGSLPKDASFPRVSRGFRPDEGVSVISFLIYANRSIVDLKRYADEILKPRLERLDGVGVVHVSGGGSKHILVEVSQNRLEAYGLNLSDIVPFISSQNVELSVGDVFDDDLKYPVQVSGNFNSINDLEDVVIAYKPYSLKDNSFVQVRLRDIATIKAISEKKRYVYYNDRHNDNRPSIEVSIEKQNDANFVTVSDAVNEELKKIKLILPKDISLDIFADNAEYIREAISSVSNSAYSGAFLALCIIFFFLRSFRATVIIGIAIPLAIIITFCLMYFANISLNIMSLSGLALSVGMLVDCSIVVIENIYRYRQKGAKLISSAILGTQEMMLPIIAATVTSICVFAPLLIFKSELGIIGDLIKDFAFTIVISLTVSLFVAIFLVPVLSSYYIGLYTVFQKPIKNKLIERIDSVLYKISAFGEKSYVILLNWVLNRKLVFLLFVTCSFIVSLLLFPFLDVSFMPKEYSPVINFSFGFPKETSLDVSKFYSDKVLEILKSEIKTYKGIISEVYSKGFIFKVLLPSKKEVDGDIYNEEEIQYRISQHVKRVCPILDPNNIFSSSSSFGGPTIEIKIMASNFESAKEYGKLLVGLLEKNFSSIVNPRLNIEEDLQIDIDIDREKAYSYGISIETIAREVKASIHGISSGKYVEDGVSYDILLKLDKGDIVDLKGLDDIFVINKFGVKVPLSLISNFKKINGVKRLFRENQSLVVKLTAGIAPNESLASVTRDLVDFVTNKVPQKDGIFVKFEGEYDEFKKIMKQFKLIILMAILLVFGVMAAQFESLLKPFIILFTIPLTLIGVILVYFISREKIYVLTAFGMLMLVGVVVNTGIVLVDYINLLLKRGFALREAVIEAGRSRFRPIVMSSLTSIVGLFPLAFSDSNNSSLLKPIAFTFIGGMIASTFLALLFIPMLFEAFSNFSIKNFILVKLLFFVCKINGKRKNVNLLNKNKNNDNISKIDANGNVKVDDIFDDVFIDED
ncbi:efflux RND transporter permease subunit [Borrelia persica]|uniref:efflux RND transporter permease subunit n=1 Tax=Borrelia persica TaxID=44448 RepID=UPI000464D04D|nr:efflux RND transporter permease subunit [Borrelia persica]